MSTPMLNDWLAICVMAIFGGLVALLWRQTLTMGKLGGINTRARDRERHDTHQLIERLLEKRDTDDGFRTAEMHRTERLRQNQLDAHVEEHAERPPVSAKTAEDRFCEPELYEN